MSSAVHQIFITSDPNIPYFLRVDWSGDLGAGFTLFLTNGSAAWTGEVSEEEVTKGASDTGICRKEYVEELHRTLIRDMKGSGDSERSKYSFQLSSDLLTYQKTSDNVLVKLGSVELQPAPDPLELNREMISQSLNRNLDLEEKNSKLLAENSELQKEHRQILKELKIHVKNKNLLEKKMYSNFMMILNDKKSKIRELQETVRSLQQTSDQPKAKVRKQRLCSEEESSLDTSHFQDPTIPITVTLLDWRSSCVEVYGFDGVPRWNATFRDADLPSRLSIKIRHAMGSLLARVILRLKKVQNQMHRPEENMGHH